MWHHNSTKKQEENIYKFKKVEKLEYMMHY